MGINICIALNISAENLKDEQFCHWVITALAEHNVPVAAMTLEITEDAVVSDPQLAVKQLTLLRKNGLTLSIDDYGTGYSSLAQLRHNCQSMNLKLISHLCKSCWKMKLTKLLCNRRYN